MYIIPKGWAGGFSAQPARVCAGRRNTGFIAPFRPSRNRLGHGCPLRVRVRLICVVRATCCATSMRRSLSLDGHDRVTPGTPCGPFLGCSGVPLDDEPIMGRQASRPQPFEVWLRKYADAKRGSEQLIWPGKLGQLCPLLIVHQTAYRLIAAVNRAIMGCAPDSPPSPISNRLYP